MEKRLIASGPLFTLIINRLCHQLIESHQDFTNTVFIGLQPRGAILASKVVDQLKHLTNLPLSLGTLDATFFRDDFRRRATPLQPNATSIPFVIDGKRVVLIDDVLFTGRSVRSALDAMIAFGRPQDVELLCLVDRVLTRELPIEAKYIGRKVNTLPSERVEVTWQSDTNPEDAIWLKV